jgi:hypothetical protein
MQRLQSVSFWLLLPVLLLVACQRGAVGLRPSDVLLREEFVAGEMGAWQIEGDSVAQTAVINEQLLISINAPNTLQFATLANPTFDDFVLEVDARQIAGHPESSYGVLFRMQSSQEFYRFEITGDGFYMLERHNSDGAWTRFVDDWTAAPAINQGLNVVNRLKVTARGDALAVSVNDVLLREVRDARYTRGLLALDAGTFGHPGLQVAFDNLLVYRP